MVEPGRRNLGERYELAELIAAGGMGQVWRGTDVLLGRPVAVKVLRSEYTGDPTFRARFRAEAQHAAGLSHPNIAAVFDYGETEATDGSGETLAYLVMELVEGEPLSAVLQRERRLSAAVTLSLLEQTASALAEAHRIGLVHRDVKPGNILVRDDGSVKITDFGIAWSAGSVPLTRTGQVIGTPQYLAPEVAEGHHATPASDVYALGLVGYECLTGRPAFDGDNAVTIALKQVRDDPEPLPDDLPGDVRSLIRRSLAKDPAARMPDGAAFVAAVEDVRAGRPVAEPAPTRSVDVLAGPPAGAVAGTASSARTAGPPRPRRRGVAVILVPVVTLLLGAAAAAGVFVAVSGDEQPGPTVVAAQTEDARIELAAEDYVGRQVDEVALALSALGLLVHRVDEVTGDVAPGVVTAVEPAGAQLRPGDTVRVLYAVAPEPAPRQRDSAPATRVSEDTGDDAEQPPRQPEPKPEPTEAAPPTATVEEELPASTPPAPTSTSGAPETTVEPEPTTSAPSRSGASVPTTPSGSTSSSSPSWDGEGDGDGDRGRDRSDG
ncbi:serine/threonine protein kinase [Geodermatophilus africanus]|uniref:non-specific serine/threonine protein kinase n=1 Tax=Geodermatophilus africanus TaxID=1137993 RepID=A0A1H3KXR6_9ACTN|nr:serine/threonine-protein kinase [Geodermatophilus africanus]SDY56941.1 serine/threonine protein kinase [Geodermatophilus africanus]